MACREVNKASAQDLFDRGNARLRAGEMREAVTLLEHAYKVRPTAITAQGATVAALAAQDWAQAKHYGRIACKLAPDWAENWHRLGAAHWGAGEWGEARKAHVRCLNANPRHIGALEQLAALSGMEGSPEIEEAYASRAVAMTPKTPIESFRQSTLLLWQGRYAEGWAAYEHRHELPLVINGWRQPTGLDPAKRWKTPLLKRQCGCCACDEPHRPGYGCCACVDEREPHLLVYHEQGMGDAIQMARYHPMLLEHCEKLTVLVHASLVTLFQQQARGRWDVLPLEPNTPAPAHDAFVGAMSLPYLFGTTALAVPPPADFGVLPRMGTRVGLCTRGGAVASLDLDRSCHTGEMAALPHDIDFSPIKGDWAATADMLSHCDLLITVDTAIAHLAGSMGIETWLIPPTHAEWRWSPPDVLKAHCVWEHGCFWYPTHRLYRRAHTNDWANVVARIKADLEKRYA